MKTYILSAALVAIAGCAASNSTPEQEVETATQDVVETVVAADEAVTEAAADETVTVDQGAAPDMAYYCTPQEKMTPICGLHSPEDAEWLPDGSGLIISEMTAFGTYERSDRISLINTETGEATLLHDASMQTVGEGVNEWGAEGVTQKEIFSPHGISLSQREDGRWQLLVVNHAETETIDFFELLQVDGQWALQWRGGVEADGVDFYNDVTANGDGFFTTRYFKEKVENLFVDYAQQLENGVVKKWTPEEGWTELSETKGVSLNGILWNEAANEFVVSEWGKSRIHGYTGEGEYKFTVEGISHPDNISWNEDRDAYLVASKESGLEKIAACGAVLAEVCEGEFNIYEITPESGLKTVRYNSDGQFWGPPSNAVERDGKLYLGSFGGTRMLVVE